MTKYEKILLGAACFFGGMVAGFLIAPIKKGVYCGNYNGNDFGECEAAYCDDEDCDCGCASGEDDLSL